MSRLKILIAASEVVPFAKTGGLADVIGALPKALRALGHDVIPRYYVVDKNKLKVLDGALGIDMGRDGEAWGLVFEGVLPDSDVPVYFIEHEGYFGRSGLYDGGEDEYADNPQRFVFFSKAIMQLSKKLHFKPELEDYDGVNLLKGGITHADAIATVSPKYSQEIRGPAFDWGLKDVINAHVNKLHGILNGVDYVEWSPSNDNYIAQKYDADDMSGKKICKLELQKIFNLPQRDDVAIIGFVGRLAEQKGISLIAHEIYNLMHLDIQIVILGAGEKWAEGFFSHISDVHRDKFGCYIGYRNDIAHKIEAGSDFFLMPSLFEPCGLNQIYSLSYGTLPIVRATGGLDDTIENFNASNNSGTGFKFYDASPKALYKTVVWAVDTWYNNKDAIKQLIQNGMKKHFGWDDTAKAYERVYYEAQKHKCNKQKGNL